MTTRLPVPITSNHDEPPPSANSLAWGTCDVVLVAERETGTTHKFFHRWRFEAIMRTGQPAPGAALFTLAIDPTEMSDSGSRYAMAHLVERTGDEGGAAMFSWSMSALGASDPMGRGRAVAHLLLDAAGWVQDASVATRYAKARPA